MATIEARDVETISSIYRFHNLPKFSIVQGREPSVTYEGDDLQEGEDKLREYCEFIERSGTSAVYTLRVYDTEQSITNKTPYKAAARFVLAERTGNDYLTQPDGKTLIIRNEKTVTGANSDALTRILDGQTKIMEMFMQTLQAQKEDKISAAIGAITERLNEPKDNLSDQILKGLSLIAEKPDIIDRIGFIIRPSAYQNMNATIVQGTDKSEPRAADPEPATLQDQLTEEQEEEYSTKLNDALDKIEDVVGLKGLADIIDALATEPPAVIAKISPEKIKMALKFL